MLRILASLALLTRLPLVVGEPVCPAREIAYGGPTVASVLPPDVSAGVLQRLRVRGCFPEGQLSVRLTGLDLSGTSRAVEFFRSAPHGEEGNQDATESGELEIELTLPADTPSGTNVALVVTTSRGDSRPYPLFVAPPERVASESEPNDQFESAPSYPQGQMVRGSLATAGDEDLYRVHLLAGQTLRAEVWSARLGLPLDAALGLHDRRGMALMLIDDGEGTGADPVLEFQAPGDGPVLLAVRRQMGSAWSEPAAYLLDVEIVP